MGIVADENAILVKWVAEQVGGCHRYFDTGVIQCLAELLLDDLGRRGIDRDQVIVMEVDAVRADLAKQVKQFRRGFEAAGRAAKGGAPDIAYRP